MQRNILSDEKICQAIRGLLKESDEKRLSTIALLRLDDVDLYIGVLESTQKAFDKVVKDGIIFLTSQLSKTLHEQKLKLSHKGFDFEFNAQLGSIVSPTLTVTPQDKSFLNISPALIELMQQKRFLEGLEKTKNLLSQYVAHHLEEKSVSMPETGLLDDGSIPITPEMAYSFSQSVKHVQDETALMALQAYDDAAVPASLIMSRG